MIGVCGYLCIDLIPNLGELPFAYNAGELREVSAIDGNPGGAVGNTGGALCKLEVPCKLGALTGNDIFAKVLQNSMEEIAKDNCKIIFKSIPNQSSGYAIVLAPKNQDRMFLACRGANDLIDSQSFNGDFLNDLTIIHFGYPPLCQKIAQNNGEELRKYFALANKKNILTSLDMSLPSPGTFSYDIDWIKYLTNVLPTVDLFCPSIDEIRFMLKDNNSSPQELAEKLLSFNCGAVLLKLGANGMIFLSNKGKNRCAIFNNLTAKSWENTFYSISPYPCKVVGTTGAGDSAIAGFLAGLHSKFDPLSCLKLASRIAAYRIAAGGKLSGIPNLETIIKKGFEQ